MININKKIVTIIILISFVLIALLTFGINALNTNNKLSDSKLYDNKYYIEKDAEKYAQLAKSSIESFNKQDSSESAAVRTKRLSSYFSSDSPVYEYTLDNIDSTYNQSEASVSSIINCPEQDDEYICLSVIANLAHKSKDDQYSEQISYWLTVKKDVDGKYKTYDMGIW